MNVHTYRHRIKEAKRRGILQEDVTGEIPAFIVHPQVSINIQPRYRIAQQAPDGLGKTLVCLIGDAHDGPGIPKERFEWIGKHIAERKHDAVVQIGDFCSLDSLCKYEPNDTLKGKHKPSYTEDMESFKEAVDTLNHGIRNHRCPLHVCLGNHEDRLSSFVDRHPEIVNALEDTPYTVLGDRGWNYSPNGIVTGKHM